MKKAILWINIILISAVVFSGCSKKKDDPTPGIKEKHMKFTFTTTGLLATDDFDIIISGGDVGGTATTLFKLNGETKNNQRGFTISNQQLRAGKVVLETVIPIFTVSIIASGSSATANHTFNFKMEPEVDGKAQPVVNKTITNAVYVEDFTFSSK